VSTPGHFPGHSSAGRFRLGSSKEAIGVLPGSDCSLSAHVKLVVLDHGGPHGPQGARSSLIPARSPVLEDAPRRARMGRCPLARGLTWLGACPAINERCRNNSARGFSAGTRGASVSWRSRRTRTRLSQRSHHIHEFVTTALSATRLPIRSSSAGAGRPSASQTQPGRGRTRSRAPESVGS
jgi:hypothetical protein